MNRWKQNALAKLHRKRRELKKRIKEEFADSGAADNMIGMLREKRKPKTKPEDLPF